MIPGERFWAKVDRRGEDECWLWLGSKSSPANKNQGGYGMLGVDGKTVYAHRFSYELHIGEIPAGFWIDHLCRTRACVNPSHLEAVTPGENIRRGLSPSAVSSRMGVCRRGHSLADAYRRKSTGAVAYCRICRRESQTARAA